MRELYAAWNSERSPTMPEAACWETLLKPAGKNDLVAEVED